MLTNHLLETAIHHWHYVAPVLIKPTTDEELARLCAWLDLLLDRVGDDEDHPLMSLIDILSQLISDYEEQHMQAQMGSGIDALKFLMEAHSLHQTDLPEIGSQGVISEILSGKRALNVRQIRLLAKRFGVCVATFID